MKRLATVLTGLAVSALLLGAGQARAQSTAMEQAPSVPHLNMFESLADTSFWNATYLMNATEQNKSFFRYDVLPGEYGVDPVQGMHALLVQWQMFADANSTGYGGSSGLGHQLPDSFATMGKLYDLSDFTTIHLSYNVLQAATRAMEMRFKLHDASLGLGTAPNSETEDWATVLPTNPLAASVAPGWHNVSIPLVDMGIANPTSEGFYRPGCNPDGDPATQSGCWSGLLGNLELNLDQISGWTFEFFAPTSVRTGDSLSNGIVAFDNMYVSGVKYDLLHAFDTAPGGWNNGGGTSSREIVTTDTVQGTGAMLFTYNVKGGESWGGSADVDLTSSVPNLAAREALSLFYKVVDPVVASEGSGVKFVFKIIDNSDGVDEEWQYTSTMLLSDTTGGWQRLVMPFEDFVLPSWVPQGNQHLNPESISKLQFQVAVNAGADVTGKVLFDRLTSYGDAPILKDPPVAVSGLTVSPSGTPYENIITWQDIPGEESETYNLYYSFDPITDVEADGVMLAAADVSENMEAYMHRIFYPVNDGELTYYYAIQAEDRIGQTSPLTVTSAAVTNTGMGIPTISMAKPAEFMADGSLSDWMGITPIHLSATGDGLGHVPEGTDTPFAIEGGDSDLSADVYLAMSADTFFFAFDVTDDIYVPVPDGATENRWLYDGAEIYLGLYNETGIRHSGAATEGDEPDYKFYVYPQQLRTDSFDSLLVQSDKDYYFMTKENGHDYVIEGKIAFADFAYDSVLPFEPMNGMRIPLDFVIMDNDEVASVNREGILAYSFWNNDNSHGQPRNWFYTWIGDQLRVVANEEAGMDLPTDFVLEQNYPNPFSPSTMISYSVPSVSHVSLKVYNVLGQEVTTLVNASQGAGRYDVRFEANGLASGLYFYRLEAGGEVLQKKMMLVR